MRIGRPDVDPHEHAGHELTLRIREHRLKLESTRIRVDPVAPVGNLPRFAVLGTILQEEPHAHLRRLGALPQLQQFDEFELRDDEFDPDRVDFHHSRQRAGILVDQIADAVSVQADLAVERRVDLRVGEILPGQREVRLRALDLGVGLLLVRRGVVESPFAGCILPDESLLPLILDIRIGQVRFRLLKVGLGRLDLRLVDLRLDFVKKLPFSDRLALLEQPLDQKSLDPRDEVHLVIRLDRRDRGGRLEHVPLRRRNHLHRRRGGRGGRLLFPAAGQHHRGGQNSGRAPHSHCRIHIFSPLLG